MFGGKDITQTGGLPLQFVGRKLKTARVPLPEMPRAARRKTILMQAEYHQSQLVDSTKTPTPLGALLRKLEEQKDAEPFPELFPVKPLCWEDNA